MNKIKLSLITIITLSTILFSQNDQVNAKPNAISVYWRTLNPNEKEIFLFSEYETLHSFIISSGDLASKKLPIKVKNEIIKMFVILIIRVCFILRQLIKNLHHIFFNFWPIKKIVI